jgi:hypothetical protein
MHKLRKEGGLDYMGGCYILFLIRNGSNLAGSFKIDPSRTKMNTQKNNISTSALYYTDH